MTPINELVKKHAWIQTREVDCIKLLHKVGCFWVHIMFPYFHGKLRNSFILTQGRCKQLDVLNHKSV